MNRGLDSCPWGVRTGKSAVRALGFGDCSLPPSNCSIHPNAPLKTPPKAGTRGKSSVARIGFGRCFKRIFRHC